MELVKKFNSYEEYEDFKRSDEYEVPNVCVIETLDTIDVKYNQNDPFWIEALEDIRVWQGMISLSGNTVRRDKTYMNYSYDNLNWTALTKTSEVLIRTGERVYFRSTYISSGTDDIGTFYISGNCNVGGNILSLIYGGNYLDLSVNPLKPSIFSGLFSTGGHIYSYNKIINAHELILPKFTAEYCYTSMFKGCKDLITTPALPATTLITGCYIQMFEECTTLKKAPTLPAKSPSSEACRYMFRNCTSLSYIKTGVASSFDSGDYGWSRGWLSGVSPTGTFIASSKRSNFSRGDGGIPIGWDLYLYDEDNDRYVVRFQINSIPYELYTETPTDVIWSEFIESDHNTNNFYITTDGYIMKDEKYIWITETTVESGTTTNTTRRVVSTESIKLHYNYILKTL